MAETRGRLNIWFTDKDLLQRAERRARLEGRPLPEVIREWLDTDYARPDLTDEEIVQENSDRLQRRIDAEKNGLED